MVKRVMTPDVQHVIARSGQHMATNLGLWRGYYRLAAKNGQTFTLGIRDASTVVFNDQPVADFAFNDRTLSWGSPGTSQGKLVFSGLWEQPGVTAGDYVGPFCEGSITPQGGQAPVDVVGKVGVFSAPAILAGYGATDTLDHWSGHYRVYKTSPDELPTDAGELMIGSYPAGAVLYNGAPVKRWEYGADLLSWPARIDNAPVNDSLALLKFTQLPNGRTYAVGSIRLRGDSESVSAYALQTEPGLPDGSRLRGFAAAEVGELQLLISTTALPVAKVGEVYQASVAATGGKPPYTWSITTAADLPRGLVDRGDGRIGGKPEQPGQYDIGFAVTDAAGAKARKNVSLSVADKTADPALAEARSWLLPVLTALLGFLSAWGLSKIKEKADEAKETKKKVEKQEPSLFDRTLTLDQRRAALRADREARIKATQDYISATERNLRAVRDIRKNLNAELLDLDAAHNRAETEEERADIERRIRENNDEDEFYRGVEDEAERRRDDAPGVEDMHPMEIGEMR